MRRHATYRRKKYATLFESYNPHLDTFLTACRAWFEMAVWTSASPLYAAQVVAAIFPEPHELAFVWASDRCTRTYDIEKASTIGANT
jgi:TFIIF-interacting CTD phosphatase-like protein